MPVYICKCRKCAFQVEPTENLQVAKGGMLGHLTKSHGYDWEFSHRVPLNDLRELFSIVTLREASEVVGYRMLLALGIRNSYWEAQRLPSISGLGIGEFKLFLKS